MGAHDGKVVVFTGAGAGIGRATVTRYVAEGAKVVGVDISPRVQELAADFPDSVILIQADISTWAGNVSAVEAARDAWGRVDEFVGNAGITDGMGPLEDIPGADLSQAFEELFALNVLAPTLGVRAALDDLAASRGWDILTGSFASSNAAGGGVLYTASKHPILGLVRQLAWKLAPDVRVNADRPRGGGYAAARVVQSRTGHHRRRAGRHRASTATAGDPRRRRLCRCLHHARLGGRGRQTGSMVTVDSGLGIRGIANPGGRVGRTWT